MNLVDRIPSGSVIGRLARLPLRLIPNGTPMPVLAGLNRGRRFIKGYGPHGYWLGIVERAMQAVVANNVRPGEVVYDIGANFGLYTLLFSKLVGKDGHVFAFEPAPRVLAGLRAHLELNGIQNVTVIEKAIAGRAEERAFRAAGDTCVGRLGEDGETLVQTTTLDLLVQELPPPNCIKMDIEGAEVEALGAASKCFRQYQPKLFLATHFDAQLNCCETLRSWGYDIRFVNDSDLLAVPNGTARA
jgi:FkbM family methyltransferase